MSARLRIGRSFVLSRSSDAKHSLLNRPTFFDSSVVFARYLRDPSLSTVTFKRYFTDVNTAAH